MSNYNDAREAMHHLRAARDLMEEAASELNLGAASAGSWAGNIADGGPFDPVQHQYICDLLQQSLDRAKDKIAQASNWVDPYR